MKRRIIMAALTAAMLATAVPVYAEETIESGIETQPVIETEITNTFLEETEAALETESISETETVLVNETPEETTAVETEIVLEETAETTEALEAYKQTGVEGFVYRLYKLVLNREPEIKGYNEWVTCLEKGMSIEWVYSGFAKSVEFQDICNLFGIQRGTYVLTALKDQNAGVTMFVYRCYEKFLGRTPDDGGLNTWCSQLLSGQMNAKESACGFVMSNEDYVKTMYLGLFDRSADSAGLSSWVEILEAGNSRESVFYGFADSQEFRSLASGFGLTSDWQSTSVTYKMSKEDFIQYLMDNQSTWQMSKSQAMNYSGYFEPGYSLIDIDLDGELDLIVTMAGGTMHNAPTKIYKV